MNSAANEPLARGLALFDARAFFDAHEVWEQAWKHSEGATRALLQALIQLAAAWIKVESGARGGARTLAMRAERSLARVGFEHPELDVRGLRGAIRDLIDALDGAAPSDPLPSPPTLSHLRGKNMTEGLSDPVVQQCPYCGERVEVSVEPFGPDGEAYVEDCPVCCRPWQVRVRRADTEVEVTLLRDDD